MLSTELHQSELVGPHGGGPDIANLSREHQGVKRRHCLGDGYGAIEAVNLQQVDIGGVEAFEGSVDGGEDCLAGEAYNYQ